MPAGLVAPDAFQAAAAKAPQAGAMAAMLAPNPNNNNNGNGVIQFLRQALPVLEKIARFIPGPLGQKIRAAIQTVKKLLGLVDRAVQAGQQVGQAVMDALRNVYNQVRQWVGGLFGGGR